MYTEEDIDRALLEAEQTVRGVMSPQMGMATPAAPVEQLQRLVTMEVQRALARALPAIQTLPGMPGRDGITAEQVQAVVEEAVARLPRPRDGRDGVDGKDGKDGKRVHSRTISMPDYERLLRGDGAAQVSYTASGSGATARTVAAKFGDVLSVKDFGAVGDGTTDDTTAFNSCITRALSSGQAVYVPAGTYKITSTLTTITAQFVMYGDGTYDTTLMFIPTANDTLIHISNGASRSEFVTFRDFAMKSTETSFTKVAIDAYDLSCCKFERLRIWGTGGSGASAGACWSGTNSIGIRTQGREATSLSDLQIIADKPIVIAANPNTTADDGLDMDSWNFHNLYLVANGNYAIAVAAGLGLQDVSFTGHQDWVGGTGGFFLNDTRAAPTVPSRNIIFQNVNCEQGATAANYYFDITATDPVRALTFINVFIDDDQNGIKIAAVHNLNLIDVTVAGGSGRTVINVSGATSKSSINMMGCKWQSGGTFTLTGYSATYIGHYSSSEFSGPSTATYVSSRTGSLVNVEALTATAENAATGLTVTGTTGDALRVNPQAGGSGVQLRAVNNANTDFEPMSLQAETFDLRYRTGAGTVASAATVNTSGHLSAAIKFYPPNHDATIQTACALYAGSGAPNNSNGANGDFYLRSDGTAGGNTVIYHKEAGSWVALVTT